MAGVSAQKKVVSYTVEGVSFNMITIKGGSFTMGATEEQGDDAIFRELPAHDVSQRPFRIGETEVTRSLWKAVMGSLPESCEGTSAANGNYPVENVSYDDCLVFIARLNEKTGQKFRLPTESEWEYAARGGRGSYLYKYPGGNNSLVVGWFDANSRYKLQPVKTKNPNEVGLYDMGGNVWEWVSDYYSEYTADKVDCPQGPAEGEYRVLRGGSWNSGEFTMRVSYRYAYYPGTSVRNVGLRLAADIK